MTWTAPALALRRSADLIDRTVAHLTDPAHTRSKTLLTLPYRSIPRTDRSGLAIVAISKNEAPYLREWLTFHRLAGVDHVYLYDNGSTDRSAEAVEPFVRSGFVTVRDWPMPWNVSQSVTAQTLAYADAARAYGPEWRWMAFIDVDEFLFSPVDAHGAVVPLARTLEAYEDLPVLTLYMTMFGSNGHVTRPDGLVIEQYPAHAPFPTFTGTKVLCDPMAIRAIGYAHYFVTELGTGVAFDERRRMVRLERRRRWQSAPEPVSDRLRFHHYFVRSQQDWEEKIEHRRRAFQTVRAERLARRGEQLDAAPSVVSDVITPFIPRVRDALAALPARPEGAPGPDALSG